MDDHGGSVGDSGIWGEKGYLSLSELAVALLVFSVLIAVVVFPFHILSYNFGRWVGTLIYDTAFDWGLPSVESFGWYLAALLLGFSGVAGANAQRLWGVDGGWSPRVLADLILTVGGLTFSLILFWLLVASTFL